MRRARQSPRYVLKLYEGARAPGACARNPRLLANPSPGDVVTPGAGNSRGPSLRALATRSRALEDPAGRPVWPDAFLEALDEVQLALFEGPQPRLLSLRGAGCGVRGCGA